MDAAALVRAALGSELERINLDGDALDRRSIFASRYGVDGSLCNLHEHCFRAIERQLTVRPSPPLVISARPKLAILMRVFLQKYNATSHISACI